MRIVTLLSLFFVFSMVSFGQTTTVKVYLGNGKMDPDSCEGKVFPVTRTIPKTKAVAKAALDELFKGVTAEESAKGYSSFFSEETKGLVISVNVVKGIAYVNLKSEVMKILTAAGVTTSCGSVDYEASMVKTLQQFPTIKKVMFAIEKDPALYYDWMQIGECPKELKKCSNKNF